MNDIEIAANLIEAAHRNLAYARRNLDAALTRRARLPGRQPGVCGTPAGYRRHERGRTVPCIPCMEAKRWDENRRNGRVRTA